MAENKKPEDKPRQYLITAYFHTPVFGVNYIELPEVTMTPARAAVRVGEILKDGLTRVRSFGDIHHINANNIAAVQAALNIIETNEATASGISQGQTAVDAVPAPSIGV